jgi:hypothetical protein
MSRISHLGRVRVHGHSVIAGLRGVVELDDYVGPDALDQLVTPLFERMVFLRRSSGMTLDFIRWTVGDVDSSTIRLPTRQSRRWPETIVRVRNSPVVLDLKLVLRSIRRWVATQPELLDEVLALLICRKAFEGISFVVTDDVRYVFVQPSVVTRLRLFGGLRRVQVGLLRLRKAPGAGDHDQACDEHRSQPGARTFGLIQ